MATLPKSFLSSSFTHRVENLCKVSPQKSMFKYEGATVTFAFSRDNQNSLRSTKMRKRVTCNAVKEVIGSVFGPELRFAVVVSRFNENVSRLLLNGALESFVRHGVRTDNVEVVWVPGSFEIPLVAQQMAKSGKFDAVLCIGVVIRGATTHYDAVAGAAANGVLNASLNSGVPCIFGVLTTENPEQALDRAGGKAGNKGAEAAVTAIEMANIFATLRESGSIN